MFLNDPNSSPPAAADGVAGMGNMGRVAGLIAHECRDYLHSARFFVGASICLVLCVLASVVRIGDFRAAHAERDQFAQRWMTSVAEQLQRDETVQIDNVRATSPLGVISVGLEPITPSRFSSTKEGIRFGESRAAQSIVDALFGRLDLAFIVGTLLSLFALALTFDSICGERMQGTLSVVLSYPISRSAVLASKAIAATAVLGGCFAVGMIAAVAGQLLAGVPLLSAAVWAAFAALSIAYLLVFVGIGVAVSARARRPADAMVVALAIWVVLVVILPRGVAVGVNALVPGTSAVNRQLELDAAVSRLKIEQAHSQQEAYASFLRHDPSDPEARTELHGRIRDAASTLEQKRRALLDAVLDQQEREETLRDGYLHAFALLTPAALFNEGAAELSWTGRLQRQRFYRDARLYDDEIGRRLVESRHTMYGAGENAADAGNVMVIVDNVRPYLVPFQTAWVPVRSILAPVMVTITVLLVAAAAMFLAAHAIFLKADVRP